jgi:DNA-binding MurR/RpiR family transcriptional regulator
MLRSLLSYARTSRMRVVTVTDHAFQPQAERFSEIVLPAHVASYAPLPTHATMVSLLRLLAVAFLARDAESVERRIETLAAIDEELNLME